MLNIFESKEYIWNVNCFITFLCYDNKFFYKYEGNQYLGDILNNFVCGQSI